MHCLCKCGRLKQGFRALNKGAGTRSEGVCWCAVPSATQGSRAPRVLSVCLSTQGSPTPHSPSTRLSTQDFPSPHVCRLSVSQTPHSLSP